MDENNSFSITIPGLWSSRDGAETINRLQKLLTLRSEKDIELHVEEVRKRGNQIIIEERGYKFSGTRKNEIIEDLKNIEYNDLEDMVFTMELTYSEIEKILDINYIDTSTIGYTLPPDVYEFNDFILILKNLLPDEVKVNITDDIIRLNSNLITNKTIRFTKRSFFYTKQGFIQSYSGLLGDIEGFVQLIPGSYKSDKTINITGIDKIHVIVFTDLLLTVFAKLFHIPLLLVLHQVIKYTKNPEVNFLKE